MHISDRGKQLVIDQSGELTLSLNEQCVRVTSEQRNVSLENGHYLFIGKSFGERLRVLWKVALWMFVS